MDALVRSLVVLAIGIVTVTVTTTAAQSPRSTLPANADARYAAHDG